jgi:hypothetical protein
MFLRTLSAALFAMLPVAASLIVVSPVVVSPAWAQTAAPPIAAPDCMADVDLSASDGLKVAVVYRCRSSNALIFHAIGEKGAHHVLSFTDGAGKDLKASGNDWWVDSVGGTVEAHYRFDLAGYAAEIDRPTLAIVRGGGVLCLLETWLFEPRGFKGTPVIDIRVHAADGLAFTSGLPRVGDAWRLSDTLVRFAGLSALGRFTLQELPVPAPGSLRPGQQRQDGVLRLVLLDGISPEGRADLIDWVRLTAQAESNYWLGFTAKQMMLGLVPAPSGPAVGFGRTVPGGGATVMIQVNSQVNKRRLFDQWVLVHELIHTGMPFIDGRGTWLMEGAATYVEPIIRARAGWKTEAEVWKEWVEDMPRGAPGFSMGLANISGPPLVYWTGATVMLMADIGIRRATKGAKGLEDCLGGVLWNGMDAARRVSVDEFVRACDRASETDVMSGLLQTYMSKPQPVDLDAYWKQLGVSLVGGKIVLDDKAPLAEWRKMIVPGPTGRAPKPVKLPWQS